MSGDVEWGKCGYCDYEGPTNRHYFRYDIKCECHSPQHFEIVWHCNDCVPQDPGIRKIRLSNEKKHLNF